MNRKPVAALMLAAIASMTLTACATNGGVPDRTPQRMTYEVLGSRISRRVDVSGKPDSANYVMTLEAGDLQTLPAARIGSRRR